MLNWKDLELITVPSASLWEVINHPKTLNTHSAIICCSVQISLYETVKGGRIYCLLMAQWSKLRFHPLIHNKTPTFPHFYSWCQRQRYFLGKIHRRGELCVTPAHTLPCIGWYTRTSQHTGSRRGSTLQTCFPSAHIKSLHGCKSIK